MAIKLIIFDTTSSHLTGVNACDYDRSGTPLELWHADGFDLSANAQIPLFTDEGLTNQWTFSSPNANEVFSIQKYDGDELHATIEIKPSGENNSTYTLCASPVWNLTFEVDGAPVVEVSEGDTVTLIVNVITNAAINGENLSWLLGGSGNGNAVLADTSLTAGAGDITLNGPVAGAVQLEGSLQFTIVTDNENADETLTFTFSDMSISDGGSGTITVPAPSDATVEILANPLPIFECTDANFQVNDGETGETVSATVDLGTLISVDPTDYVEGSATYTATIEIPVGYQDAGTNITSCSNTATGTTTPTFTCALAAVDASQLDGLSVGTTIDNTLITISNGGTFNSITPIVIQPGTSTYSVVINVPAGYDNSGTITCDVTIAGDSAPTANDDTVQVNQGSTTIISLYDLVTDNDLDSELTWTVGNLDPVISGASLSGIDGSGNVTYVAPSLTYNDGNKVQEFTYQVVDTAGNTSTGKVTINVTAADNQLPVFDSTPTSLATTLNATEPSTISYNATDADGHAITFTISSNPTKGTATIDTANKTVSYTPTNGESGVDFLTITATDSEGGVTDWLLTINIELPPYWEFQSTGFFSNTDDACLSDTLSVKYGATSEATTLSDLEVGDKIYTDQSLNNVYSSDNIARYARVESLGLTRVLELSSSGEILSISQCDVSNFLFEEIKVRYSGSENVLCNDLGGEIVNIYYGEPAGNNNAPVKTLQTAVTENIPLFVSSYWANLYQNGLNAELDGLIPAGLYQAETEPINYYKRGADNTWVFEDGSQQFSCPEPTQYSTYSINTVSYSETADKLCNTDSSVIDIYYRLPYTNGVPANSISLLEIAKRELEIFSSQEGADNNLIEDLAPSGVYSADSGEYFVWNNEGDGFEYEWYGFNSQNQFVRGSQITKAGDCAQYAKPDLDYLNLPITIDNTQGINDTNVYYAFYACEAFEQQNNLLGTTSNYWKIYVIDAGYDIDRDQDQILDVGESYIKDFVEDIRENVTDPVIGIEGYSCIKFIHSVYSETIEKAIDSLKDSGYNRSDISINSVNPIDLGFASQQEAKIYQDTGTTGCRGCRNEVTPNYVYNFPLVDDATINALGPNFDLESNYKLDNVSRPLLRTNPKLTTNVKLVVSEDDKLYLESISASKELAAIEYKKFPISPEGKYAFDVARFYNVNMTPNELMFQTKRDYSDITVLDSYEKQIEESYQYGTNYNFSKLHSEDFRIFAPIWLDTNIPKKFVIYRVNDPVGSLDLEDNASDNFKRIQSLLSNAEIIKTFDLTRDSNIGNYLRNHVQDETFPVAPITVNFEKSEKSSFNGIDLIKGGFTSKGEYLYKDYILTDKPLIEANDYITDAFRRNEIASANLINLEFLFNDDLAHDYSVNRYFGLFVDDIDSGYGRVFTINGKIHHFKELTSLVDEASPETAIPSYKQVTTSPMLAYATVGNKYFNISSNTYYNEKELKVAIEDSGNQISSHLGVQDTERSIDLVENNDHGYDFIKLDVIDTPYTNDSLAITAIKEEASKFTFIKHVEGEILVFGIDDPMDPDNPKTFSIEVEADVINTLKTIKNTVENSLTYDLDPVDPSLLQDVALFKDIFEVTVDVDNNAFYLTEKNANLGDLNLRVISQGDCIVRNDKIQTNLNLGNHVYMAESQLDAGTFNGQRYSNQGTATDIAVALSACIDSNETRFSSYNVGSSVYVVSSISGYELLQSCVLLGKGNVNDFLTLSNKDDFNRLNLRQNIDLLPGQAILERYDSYYLSGGNAPGKAILVNNETVSEINVNDFIETRYKGVYNKVIDIVEDINTENSEFSKVILEDKNDLETGNSKVYYENEVRLGLFSAYDIYDMNVDFYDTSNSDIKELIYETQEEIDYEPYINAVNNIDETTGIETTILGARDIFSEDFELNPIDYFSNLSQILLEESIDEEEDEQITSEFDRLKENSLKEYATNSRIVPNINKWVLKDSVTVREQPYYLNANEAFGRTNFSPDLTISERDREAMTHEWFYIEKPPKYLKYNQLNETFSYINFIDGFDLSPNLFKSTTYNYFDMFMISDGFEKTLTEEDLVEIYEDILPGDSEINSLENNITSFIKTNLKKKYSLVDGGNNLTFASTVFKGIKVDFKNRKEFINSTANEFVKSSEFNGYKFSVMLKVNEDAETNGISYEVIQNKQFKFVILYITLDLGDYWIDGNVNRKLLYELNHKIVFDTDANDFTYADTKFNGALKFNDPSVNWSDEGPYTIPGIQHINGTLPEFDSQITLGENGLYGDIHIDLFPTDDTNSIYKVSVVSVDSDNSLKISGKPVNITDETDILDIEFLPNSIQGGAQYTYVGGGANAHKIILERLTAKSVADLVNLNNDEVTYTTVEPDGTILNNRFVINFSDGTEIIQRSNLTIEEDTDKPKSFKLFKGNIGYKLSMSPEYYPFLIRHNGKYTVDMKPVVTFTDLYSHFKVNRLHLTSNLNELNFEQQLYKHSLIDLDEFNRAAAYYRRYNKCGISFNLGFISDDGTHDSQWGLIKNHFYHKVNEINPGGVTKLSGTSDKLPLYPLIGEIAIDKKDINVFRSSWDSNYYTRSLDGGNSINIPGTLDTHEERSYLASTVMKPKYSYNLLDFSTSYVSSEEELDEILRNSENSTDIVLFENKNYVMADFYITDTLITKLAKEGVLASISQYVEPSNSAGNKETLNDDALMYAENNLVETYILDSITLYVKQKKGNGSKIVSAVTIDQLDSDGFTIDRNNFAYRNHVQKPMNFRLIYNKRLGYSYDIKPMIKIKS